MTLPAGKLRTAPMARKSRPKSTSKRKPAKKPTLADLNRMLAQNHDALVAEAEQNAKALTGKSRL